MKGSLNVYSLGWSVSSRCLKRILRMRMLGVESAAVLDGCLAVTQDMCEGLHMLLLNLADSLLAGWHCVEELPPEAALAKAK